MLRGDCGQSLELLAGKAVGWSEIMSFCRTLEDNTQSITDGGMSCDASGGCFESTIKILLGPFNSLNNLCFLTAGI